MRYQLLDVLRGVAALAVTAFHCSNTLLTPGATWAGDALLFGWAGVFIFFPISGYCIAAATGRPENTSVRRFIARRWRRILPPYWASIAVALGAGVLALPFNAGSSQDLLYPPGTWLAVATLTQTFIGEGTAVNPVYWSLCYEEQFYLVMALGLAVGLGARWRLWFAVTLVAALVVTGLLPWLRITGLFFEHWLEFALGMAVYAWLHHPTHRAWALFVFAVGIVAAVRSADGLPLMVSLATAAIMLTGYRFERRLLSWRPIAWLQFVGVFSYSLYLIHVPIGGRVVNLLRRVQDGDAAALWVTPIAIAASVAAAWAFYRFVERRFLNTSAAPLQVSTVVPATRVVA